MLRFNSVQDFLDRELFVFQYILCYGSTLLILILIIS